MAVVGSEAVRISIPLDEILEIQKASESRYAFRRSSFPTVMDIPEEFNPYEHLVTDHVTGQESKVMIIRTIPDGVNSGRVYHFKMTTDVECGELVASVTIAVRNALDLLRIRECVGFGRVKHFQKVVRRMYKDQWVEVGVAICIACNFFITVLEVQLKEPEGSDLSQALNLADNIFTLIFAAELSINLFSNWFWPFFNNGWSVFDLVVVTTSVVNLAVHEVPGINHLRFIRALR